MKIDLFLLEFDNKSKGGKARKKRYPSYIGNPYYISGNAILHSVCDKISRNQKNKIKISHGTFMNLFPEFTYQKTTGKMLGKNLPNINKYHDLFKIRRPLFYGWLNRKTRDISLMPEFHRGKVQGEEILVQKRSFLNFYTLNLEEDPEAFNKIQLGGKRNFGLGMTKLKDHKTIYFNDLDFSNILNKEELWVELITPLCLNSEFVNTKKWSKLPSFINTTNVDKIRKRKEHIKQEDEKHNLELVDHGQAFKYQGGKFNDDKEIIYTARKGLEGIYNHGKYGYGEFMIR